MAKQYDKLNQLRNKFNEELEAKNKEIEELQIKIAKLQEEVTDLRRRLHEAGAGNSDVHRLQKQVKTQERENRTLQNRVRELDGTKYIASFTPERQQLIKNIKNLSFNNNMFNALALRFNDGLDNVIKVAYLIKNNSADDIDFYTYVFRDNIVGLLEKMLNAVIGKTAESASKHLVNLINGNSSFPKEFLTRIPELKDKTVLTNILNLINLQTNGYHGTKRKYKKLKVDRETNEVSKNDLFLNLDTESQLNAIFTLLKFMLDVFQNPNNEVYLMAVSNSWFTTIN